MQKLLAALGVTVFLFVLPLTTLAAGLVPCGGAGEKPCQTCDVVTLVNNVVGWLVMILGVIAAILIVTAGIRLVTSGGNASSKEAAKSMMTNLLIGYVIVLSGWLVIDYGLKAMLKQNQGAFGVWNRISCVAQPKPDSKNVKQEGVKYIPPPTPTPAPYLDPIMTGGGPTGGAYPPDMSAGGACATNLVQPYFGSETGNAQCIIKGESTCGASMVSVTDKMSVDGRAFSFGPMQINLTVNEIIGCAGYPPVMDCKTAFSGKNYSARVINENLYQQCARAAQNIDCGLKNGDRIQERDGWYPTWSTAAGCGLR